MLKYDGLVRDPAFNVVLVVARSFAQGGKEPGLHDFTQADAPEQSDGLPLRSIDRGVGAGPAAAGSAAPCSATSRSATSRKPAAESK